MKDNGIIDNAMISFNLATSEMKDTAFALFGDIDSSQVVGGKEGMYSFKSFDNFLGTWALEGQGILYNGAKTEDFPRSFPAIIDTGTS